MCGTYLAHDDIVRVDEGRVIGKNKQAIIKLSAFCIEPQHFPNAPNITNFASIILKAGHKYKSRNQFTFGLTNDVHSH